MEFRAEVGTFRDGILIGGRLPTGAAEAGWKQVTKWIHCLNFIFVLEESVSSLCVKLGTEVMRIEWDDEGG